MPTSKSLTHKLFPRAPTPFKGSKTKTRVVTQQDYVYLLIVVMTSQRELPSRTSARRATRCMSCIKAFSQRPVMLRCDCAKKRICGKSATESYPKCLKPTIRSAATKTLISAFALIIMTSSFVVFLGLRLGPLEEA